MDYLDIRDAEVLMWLPLMWYSRMLEAHAALLEQLIEDSNTSSVELPPRKMVVFTPDRDIGCSTSSLQYQIVPLAGALRQLVRPC